MLIRIILQRINRGTGYDNQRVVNVVGARENVGTQVVQQSGIQCYNCKEYGHVARECQKPKRAKDAAYHKEKMLLCKQEEAGFQLNAEQADWRDDTDDEPEDQELEAHYLYMAQIQEVTPDAADNSGPIFDAEPLQKVQNDNDNYNVFANDREHPEQPESVNDTYLEEQGDTNITIDSLDMSTNGETVDQDDDDLAKERDLLASLIEKLKCEIDDSKNRNKFLESSNKTLIDKLKGEIEDFKTKNKSLESSNNHFKEANMNVKTIIDVQDLKKFQAELDRYHDVNYASKMEIDCAKAKGDLIFVKPENLKKAQRANPRLYDIGCYNDNLALMLASANFSQSKSVTTNNVSNDFLNPVNAQILPQNVKSILKNTNMIAPGMYKVHTKPNQTRTSQLPQDIRKTNKRVSFSTGVIPTNSVSRPQLKSNRLEDRVMHNNSKGKKQQVKDHRMNFKFSNIKTSVTACNDSLNVKTPNLNSVSITCGKCVLNDNHDMCVLHYINGMNSRTKMPMVVPINTREPKRTVNQSVATPLKRTVAAESTNQKPRSTIRKQYEQISKTCKWWYYKITPPGYKWKPKSRIVNVEPNVSMHLGTKSRTINISESTTLRKFTVSNTPSSSNSFAARMVKFGNDQIAPILGYRDLVQGNVTIKRVYYVEGLNHNLFSVGQFCDADLEVAFRKSTCYIRDLKGNDLLTASSSQAWLWHLRLSHLNFNTINLLLKYIWTHFLRYKDETTEVLIYFLKLVQRGLHAQVRTVRTDKGMKFLNKTLHAYFAQDGIEHQMSTARTLEQNGVVKRQNHTLVEVARTMLSAAKVPLFF
ncbi:retrovirus-related pol polyprotein from transposon TNT 1-94 [Tanacetum coccineum]|uniref:Retrovirus-related pol polyprotein from transposon TNT 1-94 n=1 Tax=Tanacetum coccineum TaxID=301880 RepID=A0ABQ5GMV2_9ASTR